jgi:homoserine O-succinyltransferase
MSLIFDRTTSQTFGSAKSTSGHRHVTAPLRAGQVPVIGIVNNMPDSALAATERQFVGLVRNAMQGLVDIRLYYLPAVPRGVEAAAQLASRYEPISALFRNRLDAMIVTGNEPRADQLDHEPYWHEFADLVDWASNNTRTTLWSCLAAHAAVLHLDGISRHRLAQKKSGVLTCRALAGGLIAPQAELNTCHSRMNELRAQDLRDGGYDIVTMAAGNQVDIFLKRFGSQFLFLQGHPEYDADSLMREYRRDVGRYLNGQRETYPEVPENYFDSETVLRMENYRTKAERTRDPKLFESFPGVALRKGLDTRLATSAQSVFGAWLAPLKVSVAAI